MATELRKCNKLSWTWCDGDCEKCRTFATTETVYNRYTDTAGNYHWTGVYSGEHIVRMDGGEGKKMAILIDAEQLSKHKYVGIGFDGIDMGIPASAVNVLAYKWGWNDALDSVERLAPTVDIDAITESHEEIGYDKGFRDGYAEALEVTNDAVPIVRCKDCKWWKTNYSWNGNEHKICVREAYEPLRNAEDFCSRGERKEDGE